MTPLKPGTRIKITKLRHSGSSKLKVGEIITVTSCMIYSYDNTLQCEVKEYTDLIVRLGKLYYHYIVLTKPNYICTEPINRPYKGSL